MSALTTLQSDPNHHTVGKFFRGSGHTWFCDSYDPAIGYWMTRIDCPEENAKDTQGDWRRNVSERAIARTFHEVKAPDEFSRSIHGHLGYARVGS